YDPYFTGSLDEVEFFNRALTQTAIAAIYNARQAGKCKTGGQPPTPTPGPCYWCMTDVPLGSPFYSYVSNLVYHGAISGYACNSVPSEPCIPPTNYPYYRPSANITRGQVAKVVALAAGSTDDPTTQT